MTRNQFRYTITVLPVGNIAESCAWYEKALGLTTTYLHEGVHPGEVTNYAVMVRDGVAVHLILDEPPPHDIAWAKAGTGYLYLKVIDAAALFEEVLAQGIQPARGLETENWGATGFNLTDPSGNAIHIEQL